MQREGGCAVVRQGHLMAVVEIFLIGCTVVVVVGCAGVRPQRRGSQYLKRGAGGNQQADAKDDVIPATIRKGTLPGTGGPPLLLVPWLFALAVAGIAQLLLRRS